MEGQFLQKKKSNREIKNRKLNFLEKSTLPNASSCKIT